MAAPVSRCHRRAFDPIPDSEGKHYTIVLRAVGNAPDATVYILGARGDPYPDGQAFYATQFIDADATFRYGCLRPPRRAP
jgi:hypothetical protein